MSAMKGTFIILACWVVLLVIIYFTGIWPGYYCDRLNEADTKYSNNNSLDNDYLNDIENEAWFQKYSEYYPERNMSTLKLLHVVRIHNY